MQPSKKPRACIPCHKRKVRCDATQVGTPCTRCVGKNRVDICVLVARPRNRVDRHRFHAIQSNSSDQTWSSSHAHQDCRGSPCNESQQDEATAIHLHGSSVARINFPHHKSKCAEKSIADSQTAISLLHSPPVEKSRLPRLLQPNETQARNEQTRAEYTAPGNVFHKPSYDDRSPPTKDAPSSDLQRIVVEYYNDFNPFIIIGKAFSQPRRRGLVQTSDVTTSSVPLRERETSFLDPIDRAYLHQRRVHDLPPEQVCDSFIDLFFRHVYTYLPILDYPQFMERYREGNCSTFLLYALFVTVVPFASDSLLRDTGYTDVMTAQAEFFIRARILFDFGCEHSEFSLLQGSVLLSSFHHSLELNKNSRFWFGNAARLATQMGLHKRDIQIEVDPITYRLCRHIWWVLIQRDVFLVMAGIQSTRRLIDEESDTFPVEIEDFEEESSKDDSDNTDRHVICPQKQYFIESCKLAQYGAQFLRLFQRKRLSPAMAEVREFCKAIENWQVSLPQELTLSPSTKWNHSNTCIIAIHALFYQLKMVFYRTICVRLSVSDRDTAIHDSQQLFNATSEASLLLRQVMVHHIFHTAPPFLMDCIAQLVAIRIEIAQNLDNTTARLQSLETDLSVFVAYFEEAGKKWSYARVYCKLFKLAQGRAGLSPQA